MWPLKIMICHPRNATDTLFYFCPIGHSPFVSLFCIYFSEKLCFKGQKDTIQKLSFVWYIYDILILPDGRQVSLEFSFIIGVRVINDGGVQTSSLNVHCLVHNSVSEQYCTDRSLLEEFLYQL